MLGVERIHGVEQKALRRLLASIHSFLFQNENEMKESGSQQRSGMSKTNEAQEHRINQTIHCMN